MPLYHNLSSGQTLYGADGKATEAVNGSNIPGLTFGDVLKLPLQLLNTGSVDADSGLYDDPYTGYATENVTASAVVDVDYKVETDATVSTAIAAGVSISQIELAYSPAESPVRSYGKIYLGAYAESVFYNACALKSGATSVYVFTLADSSYASANFTPSGSYASASAAHVRTAALIKASSSEIAITKATGLFAISLDGSNAVLWDKIKVSTNADGGVSGAKLEIQIFVDGVRDRTITVSFKIAGTMDLGDIEISNPSAQDFSQLDSRYAKLAGSSDIEITDAAKGVIQADRTTGKRYRIYIDNGIIGIEEI